MIFRLPSISTTDVRREGRDRWTATGDDPQFVFAPWLLAASAVVFEIEGADRVLDPKIYLDTGKGFQPEDEIALRSAKNGVFAISLRGRGWVRRVRFDPASFPATFTFRAWAAFGAAAARDFVAASVSKVADSRRDPYVCELIGFEEGPQRGGAARQSRKSSTPERHFRQAVVLAAQKYSTSAPWTEAAPLLSFVCPVYNTPRKYLDELLDSFGPQKQGAWELILCDDGSTSPETREWLETRRAHPNVRIERNAVNGGIASAANLGINAARGSWVSFIDHDDALAPYAVDRWIDACQAHPDAKFFYCDEVVTDVRLRPVDLFAKPAYDPVLLSGVNYINHLSIFRRDRLVALGGLRIGFEGSQDYDLLLRYLAGIPPGEVWHIPYPGYLWRRDGASFSVTHFDKSIAAARRALAEAWCSGVDSSIEPALDTQLHRVRFAPGRTAWPKVSVVIPSRDAFPLISRVLNDLLTRTDYPGLEIIVVDNGSTDPRVLELYERMKASTPDFRVEISVAPFDFARQTNRGFALSSGDCILMLNNDIEVIEPGWLKEMVECLSYPDAGVVGARLLYPDGSLQHAGVIAGLGTVAGHWFIGRPARTPGPMGRLNVRQSFSAVTGACMLITRECLAATGGLDEAFAIAYNDIDFCLRAGHSGFRVIWTPFATLYHHESASRGSDETPANIERFRREQAMLRERYALTDFVDPAYSPWYARNDSGPRLLHPTSLPPERTFWSRR